MTQVTVGIWEKALSQLRDAFDEEEFNAWLSPIVFENANEADDLVTLSVASEFYQRWITRKYLEPIRAAIEDTTGNEYDVQIVVRREEAATEEGCKEGGCKEEGRGSKARRAGRRARGSGRRATRT